MVHIISAHIYRPELGNMMLSNAKKAWKNSLGICFQDKRMESDGHAVFFATTPYTCIPKDVYGTFPTSLTPEELDFSIIRSEH